MITARPRVPITRGFFLVFDEGNAVRKAVDAAEQEAKKLKAESCGETLPVDRALTLGRIARVGIDSGLG